MERIDFIKEKILTIEDYEKVDETLMNEINSDSECLRFFDECKALSGFIKKSVPVPVHNGISLSESLVQKIRNGDTAPKYIDSHSFRFPFATVACLVVVCAVVLTSRYMPEKYNRNHEAQNGTAKESYSDEEMIFDVKLTKAKDTSEAFDESVVESENAVNDTVQFSAYSSDDAAYNYVLYDYDVAPEEPKSEENMAAGGAITEKATKFENPLEDFSYEEEFKIYTTETAGVKIDGFKNIAQTSVANKYKAELLAKNECTISYDTVKIYFDADMEIWKVVFMTEATLGNCQTVYLDKYGVTQLIVYGE